MIADHRPDTLTPLLKQCTTFEASIAVLLEASRARDPRLSQLARHAVRDIRHYDCPIGIRVDDGAWRGAWILVLHQKLETPNKFKAHWSMQGSSRTKWERLLKAAVLRALGVASWESLKILDRVPVCTEKMALQLIRLVVASREFIRDDDNLAFSRKHLQDCLKPLGLVKDDRREWLTAHVVQDVAPHPFPMTICLLWPAAAGLF